MDARGPGLLIGRSSRRAGVEWQPGCHFSTLSRLLSKRSGGSIGKMQIRLGSWILASGVLLAGVTSTWAQGGSHAVVVKAARRAISPPLSQMAPLPPESRGRHSVSDPDATPLRRLVAPRRVQNASPQSSPEAASLATLTPLSTNAGLNILGLGAGFPDFTVSGPVPDANGAVGPTQFVQFVNESFVVFNKSDGSVAFGPANGTTLWQALGAPCSTNPNLDEIVQFDKLANRWVMLMPVFTSPQPHLCIAVSTTSDATGAWNLYDFPIPQNTSCSCKPSPDYPKLAVWPDAYYVTYGQGGKR